MVRELFLRFEIHAIVRSHLPKADRTEMVKSLQRLITLATECKAGDGMIYSIKKKELVKQEIIGGICRQQKRQRRWMLITSPVRPKGRRFIHWHRVLISLLGLQYFVGTGKLPTRGGTNGPNSAFERFAAPFLERFGVCNPKNLVKEYIVERRKVDPYQWCALYGSRKQEEKNLKLRSSMN